MSVASYRQGPCAARTLLLPGVGSGTQVPFRVEHDRPQCPAGQIVLGNDHARPPTSINLAVQTDPLEVRPATSPSSGGESRSCESRAETSLQGTAPAESVGSASRLLSVLFASNKFKSSPRNQEMNGRGNPGRCSFAWALGPAIIPGRTATENRVRVSFQANINWPSIHRLPADTLGA